MAVMYRTVHVEDYDGVRQLLIEVGWHQRVADRDRFEQMIERATRAIVAIEENRIVGFGRVLTDGASNGYISTLAVAPDRQRQGIGRGLVEKLIDVGRP